MKNKEVSPTMLIYEVSTLRKLIDDNPELNILYDFEYSFKYSGEQDNFRQLDEILGNFGYKIINEDYIPGEYNDIKGYLDFEVANINYDR